MKIRGFVSFYTWYLMFLTGWYYELHDPDSVSRECHLHDLLEWHVLGIIVTAMSIKRG